MRWHHPRLGLLPPSSFIAHGRGHRPDPAADPARARGRPAPGRRLATPGLDLAGRGQHLARRTSSTTSFAQQVVAALRRSGVAAASPQARDHRERADGRPGDAPARCCASSTTWACEISIDDFGTGYSSLAYLADLPVDEVKIDRSFVSRMSAGSSETIIVNSTIDLAHHLGLRAVAEGVEDWSMLPRAGGAGLRRRPGLRHQPPAGRTRRHPLAAGLPQHVGAGGPSPPPARERSGRRHDPHRLRAAVPHQRPADRRAPEPPRLDPRARHVVAAWSRWPPGADHHHPPRRQPGPPQGGPHRHLRPDRRLPVVQPAAAGRRR